MTEDKIAKTDKALAVVPPGALEAAPDYFEKNDRRGFEDTKQTDVLIPRLALVWRGAGGGDVYEAEGVVYEGGEVTPACAVFRADMIEEEK